MLAALLTILGLTITPAMGAGLVLAQSDGAATGEGAAQKKSKLVELWRPGDVGERMNIRGRVTSIDGTPLAGVRIFLRQADGSGDYHDERYNTVLESDQKGLYQFGSVVPGNYFGPKHVHLAVNHDGYEYLDTQILFRGDPAIDETSEPNAIFLEESTVKGETILFGRFDIRLTPN
jgi:protocatechuate 3,4-dioxygenase beta subunit